MEMGGKEGEAADPTGDVSVIVSVEVRGAVFHGQERFLIPHSLMAHASPNPSYVDVPRPNSSMMIKESFVAA